MGQKKAPKYDKPPVIEVVCGLTFKEIDSLLAPHLGLLWEKFKKEYPTCKEVPPLTRMIERFGDAEGTIELRETPPLPRTWFIHEQETAIIQLQRDRFLHNWRKVSPTDAYPSYEYVVKKFSELLPLFEEFLGEMALGSIHPEQYELSYINHIPQGHGWNTLDELGNVFPDFKRQNPQERFFPEAESVNWKTTLVLPNRVGRIHVTIRGPATRTADNVQLIRFELTARGMPQETSRNSMWEWLDLAHEWIVFGFTDLTSEQMHQTWGRTQ